MSTTMQDARITAVEVQFARQLYDSCRERYGEDNPQTRLVLNYLAALDHRSGTQGMSGRLTRSETDTTKGEQRAC